MLEDACTSAGSRGRMEGSCPAAASGCCCLLLPCAGVVFATGTPSATGGRHGCLLLPRPVMPGELGPACELGLTTPPTGASGASGAKVCCAGASAC